MESKKPPNPRLRVRQATPDDAATLANIMFDAFGPGVTTRLMHPDGGSAKAKANFAKELLPPPEEAGDPSTELIIMVAELLPQQEGQPPEVVAFAKWTLVREPLPRDKWDVDRTLMEELGDGSNPAVYNRLFEGLYQLRRKWIKGDPRLYLNILACAPTRHRLGAGSALLQWGTELADKEGQAAWLGATPTGYPLYRRFGFEDVDVQDVPITDLWGPVQGEHEDWGAASAVALAGELPKGCFRTVLMRRPPQKA